MNFMGQFMLNVGMCRYAYTLSLIIWSFLLTGQITVNSLPYTPPLTDFDDYNPSSSVNLGATIPSGWTAVSTGTPSYQGQGDGSSSTGGYWGYGTGSEFSLGALRSDATGDITYTVTFMNNTSGTITSLTVGWHYEQWRYANTSGWNLSGTGAIAGNPTVNNADFAGTVSGSNGVVQITPVSLNLTSLNIVAGATFGFSWTTTNPAGAENGISIDNFTIAAFGPGTLAWVLLDETETQGSCSSQSDCDDQIFCFGLQYIPGLSGTLTSYTTQFSSNCTSLGSGYPVISNTSCAMSTGNVNLFNVCPTIVFFQANGNSGSLPMTVGVPETLHQICLELLPGEVVTIQSYPGEYSTSFDNPIASEQPVYNTTIIDADGACLILPVTWLDFAVEKYGDLQSLLTWITAQEVNNSHFIIERADANDHEFRQIGRVDAISGDGIHRYSFVDKSAKPGRNYYRVTQYDHDQHFERSVIRDITFISSGFYAAAWPNPAVDQLNILLSNVSGESSYKIVSMIGQTLLSHRIESFNPLVSIDVDILSPGVYTLIVENGLNRHEERIFISR